MLKENHFLGGVKRPSSSLSNDLEGKKPKLSEKDEDLVPVKSDFSSDLKKHLKNLTREVRFPIF